MGGYNRCVWMVISLGTFNGLAISLTLKYLDNIVIIFSHALAMIVVSVVSARFFGLSLSVFFVGGGALVLVALWMFYSAQDIGAIGDACESIASTHEKFHLV